MGVTFDQRTVENDGQRWRALVVAAEQPVVLGGERLRELRDSTEPGSIDRMMVERMRELLEGLPREALA